jgi:hypothetical protein
LSRAFTTGQLGHLVFEGSPSYEQEQAARAEVLRVKITVAGREAITPALLEKGERD